VQIPGAFVAYERSCQKGEIDMVHLDRLQAAGEQPHIVIPYNYADHEFASKLTAALRHDRITQWIDDIDMSAGVLLVNRIAHAARPVDCVVPIISALSVASSWVQHDLKTVMARSFIGRHVRVLPARTDDSALPDVFASRPYFDFHLGGWNVAYDELLVAVLQRTGPKPAATQGGFRLPRPSRLT
jgi:hypothetical protein